MGDLMYLKAERKITFIPKYFIFKIFFRNPWLLHHYFVTELIKILKWDIFDKWSDYLRPLWSLICSLFLQDIWTGFLFEIEKFWWIWAVSFFFLCEGKDCKSRQGLSYRCKNVLKSFERLTDWKTFELLQMTILTFVCYWIHQRKSLYVFHMHNKDFRRILYICHRDSECSL